MDRNAAAPRSGVALMSRGIQMTFRELAVKIDHVRALGTCLRRERVRQLNDNGPETLTLLVWRRSNRGRVSTGPSPARGAE